MTVQDRLGRADRTPANPDHTGRAGQVSTRVRQEWQLAKADLAGNGRSALGGGLLGAAAAVGSAAAVVLGLAVVAIDLAWLPWPVLLLVVVMVAAVGWMAVRLSRRRRHEAQRLAGAPGPAGPGDPRQDY